MSALDVPSRDPQGRCTLRWENHLLKASIYKRGGGQIALSTSRPIGFEIRVESASDGNSMRIAIHHLTFPIQRSSAALKFGSNLDLKVCLTTSRKSNRPFS